MDVRVKNEIINNFRQSYKELDYKSKIRIKASLLGLSYDQLVRKTSQKLAVKFGTWAGAGSAGLTLYLSHSLLRASEVGGAVAVTVGAGIYLLNSHLLRRDESERRGTEA